MSNAKLAFVVGGAQKSGTTTLDAILRLHGGVQMARVKETHFFDDETMDWSSPDYTRLDAQFDAKDGRMRGEATPITLYWRPAIRRLAAYNRGIKLVFLLRDPVARAFANWKKELAAGTDTLEFSQAIRAFPQRVRDNAETEGLHRVYSYVERGFYGAQLSYLMEFFPRASIHCEIFEEFFADRDAGLARIASFLGIAPFPQAVPPLHKHMARDIAYPSSLTAEDRAFLSALYRGDIARTETILGRSLACWRDAAAAP